MSDAANATVKEPEKKHKRQRSGTASFHMSAKAVSLSVPEVYAWTPRQCLDFLVKARWGGWDTIACPHCGTLGKHCWRGFDSRWKCSACRSTFSVTSKTVFSHHKFSLQDLIARGLTFMNSAAGQPALEAKRHFKCSYNSAFTFQTKMREGCVRGYNVGLLSGDIEMDGSHQSGHRAAEKRGKPQAMRKYGPETGEEQLTADMLTTKGKNKARKVAADAGAVDPQYGHTLPKARRIVVTVTERSGTKGMGGLGTRVVVARAEDADVVKAALGSFVCPAESVLNTDTSSAYTELGKQFLAHRMVEHSRMLVGPNGENNNQAESINHRFDRAEATYTNIEPKYMLDYMCEMALRTDTRKLPNGEQLRFALNCSMGVGRSKYWTGFTHGRHRKEELLHPKPQPAPSSGPKKGKNPNSQLNGRAPR